jgi:hypothetical protein
MTAAPVQTINQEMRFRILGAVWGAPGRRYVADKTKVLYIAGSGRSGSTIVGSVLGHLEDFVHVGELHNIWTRGIQKNYGCSCGAPFAECPVWSRILAEAYGEGKNFDIEATVRGAQIFRTRSILSSLSAQRRAALLAKGAPYLRRLSSLYEAIADVTGARVIVDSSKFYTHGYAVNALCDIDMYVLHLVRDPRGVSYSWQKRKPEPGATDRREMFRFSTWKSTWLWNTRNVLTEFLFRRRSTKYVFLRYEDFADRPKDVLENVLNWIGQEASLEFLKDKGRVTLSAQHSFSGNPVRFHTGQALAIRNDNAWKKGLRLRDRAMVSALAWPLMLRYRYSWWA